MPSHIFSFFKTRKWDKFLDIILLENLFEQFKNIYTCAALSLWGIIQWNVRAIVACNQKGGHTYGRGEDYMRVTTPYSNHLRWGTCCNTKIHFNRLLERCGDHWSGFHSVALGGLGHVSKGQSSWTASVVITDGRNRSRPISKYSENSLDILRKTMKL